MPKENIGIPEPEPFTHILYTLFHLLISLRGPLIIKAV